MARTATNGIDYTDKDYESFRAKMLETLQKKMPEYTDLRESDAGVVIIELLAMGLDVLSMYQDIYANEAYITTAEQRENVMKWCSMLGYTPRFATSAKFEQIFELIGVQSTDVTIPKGTVVKTSGTSGEEEVYFETTKDLLIPKGMLGNEKSSDGNSYMYSVVVSQGLTISNELLGSSDESANQTYTLKTPKVIIDDTLGVFVNSGYGFEKWERVDNFIEAQSYNKQYTVNVDNSGYTTILFGDGVFGKIPPLGKNNIYATYRVGGGSQGNVGANKIVNLDTKIALVKSTTNPDEAFERGLDEETLDEIRNNAPIANRTRWGAITLQDFADTVIEHFHPKVKWAVAKRDEIDKDDVHIYVMLEGNETLTESYKTNILDIFDANKGGRKLIGADEIFIEPPIFRELTLTANLIVSGNYQLDLVKSAVEKYINNYLAKGVYPFNTEFSYTIFSADIIKNVEGVRAFRFTNFSEDILTPEIGEVFALKSLSITATGGGESGV